MTARFTLEEWKSMAMWDCVCDALPMTAEERREIDERDREFRCEAKPGKVRPGGHKSRADMTPEELEAVRKADRERKRAPKRRDAEENRELCNLYYAAHRDEILARRREKREKRKAAAS